MAARRQARHRTVVALLALLTVIACVGLAGPATAQDGPAKAPAITCRTTQTVEGVAVERPLLPVDRWGDAAAGGFHSRLDPGTFGLGSLENRTVRGAWVGGALGVGNSLWQGTTSLVEFATMMPMLDTAGCAVDRAAAAVGRTILMSGLLSAAVVVLLLGVAWRAWRRGSMTGSWTTLARAVLVVALFAVMLAGAQRTSGPSALGTGSPAWLMTTLDGLVGSVAAAPVRALDDTVTEGERLVGPVEGDALHCSRYVAELRDRYRTSVDRRGRAGGPAAVPLALSAMWERAGLLVWQDAQFGPGNDFGAAVGCRLLERRAQVPAAEQRPLTAAAARTSSAFVDDAADVVFVGADALTTDRIIVAWASCDLPGGWRADSRWQQVEEREPVTTPACRTLFWAEGDVGATQWDDPVNGEHPSPFEFPETPELLPAHVLDPDVQTFLLNFHGHAVMGAVTVSGVYVLVSLVVALVFGLLGLGIVVAKVALIAMAIMSFVALVLALLPGTGGIRLGRWVRMTVGLLLFAFVAQLLLALVLLLTDLVAAAGFAVFDGASVEGIMWLGFAPIAALLTLHLLISRGLGLPSPFVPSVALAQARAAASGALAAGALDRLNDLVRSRGAAPSSLGGEAAASTDRSEGDQRARHEPSAPHGANPQAMVARVRAPRPDEGNGGGPWWAERTPTRDLRPPGHATRVVPGRASSRQAPQDHEPGDEAGTENGARPVHPVAPPAAARPASAIGRPTDQAHASTNGRHPADHATPRGDVARPGDHGLDGPDRHVADDGTDPP